MRVPNTLRGQLVTLALSAIVPFVLFAAAVAFWSSRTNAVATRQGLENTVRALALALDGRVQRWQAALAALATSSALTDGDLLRFYRQAHMVAEREGGWIVVSLPSGEQAINTLMPYGAALPRSLVSEIPDSILREPAEPHVSDLFVGPVAQRPVLSVSVQVVRNRQVTHVLHLGVFPRTLEGDLQRQHLPWGWMVWLVDGRNRIIARTPGIDRLVGAPAAAWYADGSAGRQSGVLAGTALDGTDVDSTFVRLEQAGWTLALSLPTAELRQAWAYPLLILGVGGAILLAAVAGMFALLSARMTRPIDNLVSAARATGRGELLPPAVPPQVPELVPLHEALIELSHMQLLLRESHHRIKNSLQLVAASLALQGRVLADGAARDYFEDAQAHIQAIARLHDRLCRTDGFETVGMAMLAHEICADVAAIAGHDKRIRLECEGGVHIPARTAGPFALVLAELVINAVKHAATPPQARPVTVRCRVEAGRTVSVTVSDGGEGVPLDFDLSAQCGLGLRMCLALTGQIGGGLRVVPFDGATAFELRMPLPESSSAKFAPGEQAMHTVLLGRSGSTFPASMEVA